MSDYRTVESTSWFSRIVESIKGVLVGIVLILLFIVVLFWNEGRAVQTARSLEEGSSAVVSVKADSVEAANDGKLVHVTGEATTKEQLSDSAFGVSASALVLRRQVEMFQWREDKKSETKKKVGGGEETITDYTYREDWASEPIDSSSFKVKKDHENPSMPYEATSFVAKEAKIGGFALPERLVKQINKEEPLPATDELLAKAPDDVKGKLSVHEGKAFLGKHPDRPSIGDVRVTYSVVKPTTVSVVAVQRAGTFEPYPSKAGDDVELLQLGSASADAMFKSAQESNATMTWILRVLGFILIGVGFYLVFRPLETFADVIPFIGNLIGAGLALFAILISFAISAITISIAWLFYRPLIGALLLVCGLGGAALLVTLSRKKRSAA